MKTRQLGREGFEIGEMGIGCWQLSGNCWGDITDETAMAILRAAADHGMTFFDTADVYGPHRSEEHIGRFLQESGADVVVATKSGRGDVFPDKYSRDNLRESVAGSAARLGVECLDLLQLHCVPMEVLKDGAIFDWLRELQKEGRIRHFGASVESVEEGLVCLEQDGLQSLQVIFNPFRQKLVTDLFPQAQAAGAGIIVRLPLASGLLTGKFTKETEFRETDHRNFNRDGQAFNAGETFAGLPFEAGVDLVEELRPRVPEGMSLAQMTLRWILDHEAVSVIIPGASSPRQVAENAGISDLPPLPPELHEFLRGFYDAKVKHLIRGVY
ncbi:MAG: aldo/keto reductase [Akkermansiaceae bacterium]|nr:aldo/keto reductase [Akkermansiaceae bacterium]NNM30595.1 aldo/keto reductase [Akkermansiaceae bacterium]